MIIAVVLLLAAIYVATYYPTSKVGAFLNALVNDELDLLGGDSSTHEPLCDDESEDVPYDKAA